VPRSRPLRAADEAEAELHPIARWPVQDVAEQEPFRGECRCLPRGHMAIRSRGIEQCRGPTQSRNVDAQTHVGRSSFSTFSTHVLTWDQKSVIHTGNDLILSLSQEGLEGSTLPQGRPRRL